MNIYAIRDRLIDYFQQPFVGPDDKNVLASVARLINNGEITSDIAQAPHHFEVWRLGQVTEDGHLVPERELLQDCAALVRRDIRQGPGARSANPLREAAGPATTSDREAPGAEIATGPNRRPVPGTPEGS